jgi:hypothetical protein
MRTRSSALLILSVALAAPCICVLRLACKWQQHRGRVPSHRRDMLCSYERIECSPNRAATAAASG